MHGAYQEHLLLLRDCAWQACQVLPDTASCFVSSVCVLCLQLLVQLSFLGVFREAIEVSTLCCSVCCCCHRFSDNFAQQSSETRRQFKHIRYEIEDVLKDIVAVLGPDALLEVLASQLSEALTGGTNGIKDWKDAEAAYFCMKALADQPPQHCNPRLLQVCSRSSLHGLQRTDQADWV